MLQVPLVSTHFIFLVAQLPNELRSPWTYFLSLRLCFSLMFGLSQRECPLWSKANQDAYQFLLRKCGSSNCGGGIDNQQSTVDQGQIDNQQSTVDQGQINNQHCPTVDPGGIDSVDHWSTPGSTVDLLTVDPPQDQQSTVLDCWSAPDQQLTVDRWSTPDQLLTVDSPSPPPRSTILCVRKSLYIQIYISRSVCVCNHITIFVRKTDAYITKKNPVILVMCNLGVGSPMVQWMPRARSLSLSRIQISNTLVGYCWRVVKPFIAVLVLYSQ